MLAVEHDLLVGNYSGHSVGCIRVDSADVRRRLGASNKESADSIQEIQALKIQVSINDVDACSSVGKKI